MSFLSLSYIYILVVLNYSFTFYHISMRQNIKLSDQTIFGNFEMIKHSNTEMGIWDINTPPRVKCTKLQLHNKNLVCNLNSKCFAFYQNELIPAAYLYAFTKPRFFFFRLWQFKFTDSCINRIAFITNKKVIQGMRDKNQRCVEINKKKCNTFLKTISFLLFP